MPEESKRYTPPKDKPEVEQEQATEGQTEQELAKSPLWQPKDEEASPEELAARMGQPEGYDVDDSGPKEEHTPSRQFGPDGKLYEMQTDPRLPPIEAPEGAKAGVVSAFVIIQERDGRFWATNDLDVVERLVPDRQATTFDMIPGCSQVISDVEMMKTVQNTVNAMMQTSMAAQEQARIEKMAGKLAQKGIHIPR